MAEPMDNKSVGINLKSKSVASVKVFKPKSILKKGTKEPSDEQPIKEKQFRFDQNNLTITNQPLKKDYGLMKIEEVKTPFPRKADKLDADLLINRLKKIAELQSLQFLDGEDSDDDFMETVNEKAHRLAFEDQRRKHYNEFFNVKYARQLIEDDEEYFDVDTEDDYKYEEVSTEEASLTQVEEPEEESETVGPDLRKLTQQAGACIRHRQEVRLSTNQKCPLCNANANVNATDNATANPNANATAEPNVNATANAQPGGQESRRCCGR